MTTNNDKPIATAYWRFNSKPEAIATAYWRFNSKPKAIATAYWRFNKLSTNMGPATSKTAAVPIATPYWKFNSPMVLQSKQKKYFHWLFTTEVKRLKKEINVYEQTVQKTATTFFSAADSKQ